MDSNPDELGTLIATHPPAGGSAFDTAAVIAYLDGRNPATADTITAATSSAGGGYVNATCLTP